MRALFDHIIDLAKDVAIELHARRLRSVLLLVAVALSTGSLGSAVGISEIAASQIDATLAASVVDMVAVAPVRASTGSDETTTFPTDAQSRAENLDLVEAAGLQLVLSDARTARLQHGQVSDVSVVGATPGFLNAVECTSANGSLLDSDMRIALIGEKAGADLGVPTSGDLTGVVIWIDGLSYSVIGHVASDRLDMSNDVVIPYNLALAQKGNDMESQLLVRTALGAGAPVAEVIRESIRPDAPQSLTTSHVVDLAGLRTGVAVEFNNYVAGVGAFLLALTALLVANSMVVSVTSRTAEIGLRRAMGASASDIAVMVLTEGAVLGFVGGLTGSAVGAITIVVISAINAWTAAFSLLVVMTSPVVGALVGFVSSALPADRAARIQPAIAVRAD